MTNVWGVHMPVWVGDDPIEKSYVCLGWAQLGDIFSIPADREDFKRRIAAAYPEKKAGAIPVDAGILFRFAHEVAAGDLIIYPSKHNPGGERDFRPVAEGSPIRQAWQSEPTEALGRFRAGGRR